MTKNNKEAVEAKLKAIETVKAKIAKQRDILREHCSDLEDVLQSLELADDDLESGMDLIRSAVDEVSKYL